MSESAELPAALAGLVGSWRGDGVGSAPGLDHDFRFTAEVTVAVVGPGVLAWTSSSRSHPDDPPVAAADWVLAESGYLRYDATAEPVELVMARAAGVVSLFAGRINPDPSGDGAHLELASEAMAYTASGEPASGERRLYARRGEVLLFAVERKERHGDLVPRASGALHPVAPGS